MANGRFISYLRVSTDSQGQSGLGLEAQRAAVAAYLNGGNWELVGEFVEVESGKRADRPELARAIAAAKRAKATLVVAKLDRLSRSVAFLSALMEAGIDFVAADNPHANKLMVHMLAAFAEHERDQISARTKAALAAARARGQRLGNPVNLAAAQAKGAAVNAASADAFAAKVAPIIATIPGSLQAKARELNARAVPTPSGATGSWTATAVRRVMARQPATA